MYSRGGDERRKNKQKGEIVVQDGREQAQSSSPKKGHREPKMKDDGRHLLV